MSTKYREQRIKKHTSIYRKKRRVGLELASDSRDEVRQARSTAISISDVDIAKVIKEATDRHNRKVSSGVNLLNEQWMNPNQDASMLSGQQRAIVTAYLRHSYTNYETTLLPLGSNEKAYETIKRKFNEAIWERYPELSFEKDAIASNIAVPIHVPADFSVDELTAEERRTVLAAIDERIIIENVVLEHLVDDTCFSMNKGSLNKLTPKYRDIPPQGRLATAVVSYALRKHSNLESVLVPYLNRPGFPAAWDLLHASVLEAFALRLPEYAQAFRSIRHLPAHDWQQKKYALAWTSLSGEARSTELLVTRTTIEHMLRTPPSTRTTPGYEPKGLMGALETCFQDYTNFNYEIAFLYEPDFKADPSLRHELTVQVLNAIADTYPQLRAVSASRISELTASKEAEEAAERARQERVAEQAKERARQEQEEAERSRLAQAQLAGFNRKSSEGGLFPSGNFERSLEKERRRVAHEAMLEEHRRTKQLKREANEKQTLQHKANRESFKWATERAIELLTVEGLSDEELTEARKQIETAISTQSPAKQEAFIGQVTGAYPHSRELYEKRMDITGALRDKLDAEADAWEFAQLSSEYPGLREAIEHAYLRRQERRAQRIAKNAGADLQA